MSMFLKIRMSNFSEGRSPVVETFFHSSTLACCRVELRANIEKFDMSNIFGL